MKMDKHLTLPAVIIQLYKTVIVSAVVYGCEPWSVTLWEERRLRVVKKRVLREIFGTKKNVVTWEWKRLHNEELNYLYCKLNII